MSTSALVLKILENFKLNTYICIDISKNFREKYVVF
jgi:hypothetical protein